MTTRASIMFLVPEMHASNPVYVSQVATQRRVLERVGFRCATVVSDCRVDSPTFNEEEMALRLPIPERPGFYGLLRHVRSAYSVAERVAVHFKPDFVYTRNQLVRPLGRRLSRRRGAVHVTDVRGLAAAEAAYKRGRHSLSSRLFAVWERHGIRSADRVVCVSERMKAFIESQRLATVTSVIPCCVDPHVFTRSSPSRARIRQLLGISSDQRLLVYSGGASAWQLLPQTLRLMADVARLLPGRARFLVLTGEPDAISTLANVVGIDRSLITISAVPFQDVPAWLSAADAAVILREDTLVNQVASPIKVAEYLACGLPVVCSPGIGDYSDMVRSHGLGCVLDGNGDAERVAAFLAAPHLPNLQERVESWAREKLSWGAQESNLRAAYAKAQGTRRGGRR